MKNCEKVMSLSKFLSRYVCMQGDNLKRITHEEVKYLFPYLKRASFALIEENRELLYMGKITLVNDGKKTIPYFTPELEFSDIEYNDLERQEEEPFQVDDNHYDYSRLSEYELRQLLRRKFSSYRNQINARRELSQRGIAITKKYNRASYKNVKDE